MTFHSAETGYTVLKANSFQRPHEDLAVIVHQLGGLPAPGSAC
ncbi:hypothetical protein [Pontibacter brevis]